MTAGVVANAPQTSDMEKRPDVVTLFLFIAACAGFVLFTDETLRHWWWEWTRKGTYYEHGMLAVPCVLLVLWFRAQSTPIKTGGTAWVVALLFGVAVYYLASLRLLRAVQSASLLWMLGSIAGYLCGGKWFRRAALPALAVLALAMPLPGPLLNDATSGLQSLSAAGAANILSACVRQTVERTGNLLSLPNYAMEVAAPCSGLQTLMMSLLLALVLAALSDLSPRRAVLFFTMALPVALGANIFRIVVIGLVGNTMGESAAHTAHDGSGLLGLVACAGLLYFLLRRFGCQRLAGQSLS